MPAAYGRSRPEAAAATTFRDFLICTVLWQWLSAPDAKAALPLNLVELAAFVLKASMLATGLSQPPPDTRDPTPDATLIPDTSETVAKKVCFPPLSVEHAKASPWTGRPVPTVYVADVQLTVAMPKRSLKMILDEGSLASLRL